MDQQENLKGDHARQKVLIVDDVPGNIEIVYRILHDDYKTLFAKSGADAVRVAQREMPDLILLDIMMPDMDGYQVREALKRHPQTAEIPVIFITALRNVDEETRGLECGAIDYITKPINPPILMARVRNHLEQKRRRDQLEELTLEQGEKIRRLELLARKGEDLRDMDLLHPAWLQRERGRRPA